MNKYQSRNTFLYLSSLSLLVIALFMSSCKKDLDLDEPPPPDSGVTESQIIVEGIRVRIDGYDESYTSVTLTSTFETFVAESFDVIQHGHVVATHSNPTITNNIGMDSLGPRNSKGVVVSTIEGLTPGETYYFRPYIIIKHKSDNTTSDKYIEAEIFDTKAQEGPDVKLLDPVIMATYIDAKARIEDFKEQPVTEHGFIWSTVHATEDSLTLDQNTATGIYNDGPVEVASVRDFNHKIENLTPATIYYVRAYAKNQFDVGYSQIVQMNTLSDPEPSIVIDTVYMVSDANGTNEPNPGELLTYLVRLKNVGEATAQDLMVNFTSQDATINNAQPSDFGTISSGGVSSRQIPIQISPMTFPDDDVLINLEMTSGSFEPWSSSFQFTLTTAPEPSVIVETVTLVSDGNNSGSANPGEIVTYSVKLKNIGEVTAENVTAIFSSMDAVVLSGQSNFNAIAPGNSATELVELQINNTAITNNNIAVSVGIESGNFDWDESFDLFIAPPPAPTLVVQNISLVDDENNDGQANPSEVVSFQITLSNTGDLAANNVSLELLSNSNYTITSTNPVSFGNIPSGETGIQTIVLQIGDNTFWGQEFSINAEATSDLGSYMWDLNNLITVSVTSPYVVTDGLQFYMTFENTNGSSVTDEAGNFSGDLFGPEFSSDVIPGTSGQSMAFSGTENDYIYFANNPMYNFSNVSFSLWYKTSSSSAGLFNASSAYNGSAFEVYLKNEKVYYNHSSAYFNYPITNYIDNNWHHLTVVCNENSEAKLYFDGELKTITSAQIIQNTNHLGFMIGWAQTSSTSTNFFNGKMDNLRIYNRALTASEVETIHSAKQ